MARLNLDVLVNVKGADKLTGLSGGLQRTGAKLSKFVTLPLLGVGAAATTMALDAQKSADKLNAAFANMGDTSGKTLAQLNEQADRLGEATIFDDENIREAQATLLKFGAVSGEAFDRALEASSNFAAATGQDAASGANALGKALADPIAGLSRLQRQGIIFTDSQKEQIAAMVESGDTLGAQNLILGEFERRFGETNAVMQASPAGQTAQSLEDLANAGEDIGAILLPPLATLAQGLSGLARGFQSLDPGIQTFILVIAGIVAAIGPVLFISGKLIGAFKAVGAAFNVLKLLMLTNPFVLLAAAVIAIAALIILNWDKISKFLGQVWGNIQKAVGGFVDKLKGAFEGLRDAVRFIWEGIVGIVKGAINGVIDVINGLFGFLNGIQIGIPEINVGPVHVGGGVIDPFNIGLIPHLAQGGIIDSPTLALLGESGPEAVIPLGQAGTETHFHSHIEIRGEEPFIRDEDGLVRVQQRIAFLEGF